MELRHLRYFTAVAEELHFGRAAARVHIAQPAVSRQVRALEDEIGVKLLERDRRCVNLTAAGTAFLRAATELLAAVDQAVETARRANLGEFGVVRIGYVPALIHTGLPDIVRAFRERLPAVEVRMQEMTPALQVDALLAERIDVGFVRGPVHEPSFQMRTVLKEPLIAALPSGHQLGRRKCLRLAMLAREPFVFQARARGPGSHDQILSICRDAGFSPRIVQEGSYTDLLSLVASGAGVAIVPTSLQVLRRDGVLFRPLRERPRTQLDMIWRRDTKLPVLHEFLTQARASEFGLRRGRARAVHYGGSGITAL